jgi:hypothetical protein
MDIKPFKRKQTNIRTILNLKKNHSYNMFKRRVFSSQKAGIPANLSVFISDQHQTATLPLQLPGMDPEEHTEAKNNGYVAFRRNIHETAGK